MPERRRSSSTNVVSPEADKNLVETPATSSSSECSPDVSPNRQNALHRQRKPISRVTSPVPEAEASCLQSCFTYRGLLRTNRLMSILFLVAFLSLGFTVVTNRAVIKVEGEVMDKGELEDIAQRYKGMEGSPHIRSKNPPAGGLRGSLIKTAGGNKKGDHHKKKKIAAKKGADKDKKTTKEKPEKPADKGKNPAKVTKEKPEKPAEKEIVSDKVPNDENNATKAKEATTSSMKKLAVAVPSKKLKTKQSFNSVDPKMFDPDAKSKTESARVLYLHDSIIEKSGPISRHIRVYPSDFTDNTQLYGVLDSGDERLSKMELRDPYSDEHCVPMQDWQTTFHPSCNGMHEMALDHMGADIDNDFHLFGTKGFWRNAWKVDILGDHHRSEDRETVVLKTLK